MKCDIFKNDVTSLEKGYHCCCCFHSCILSYICVITSGSCPPSPPPSCLVWTGRTNLTGRQISLLWKEVLGFQLEKEPIIPLKSRLMDVGSIDMMLVLLLLLLLWLGQFTICVKDNLFYNSILHIYLSISAAATTTTTTKQVMTSPNATYNQVMMMMMHPLEQERKLLWQAWAYICIR